MSEEFEQKFVDFSMAAMFVIICLLAALLGMEKGLFE